MENVEFQTKLRYLGQDVGYVLGLRMQKDMQKCISQLNTTGNTEQFCLKLAEMLSKFSTYTRQYAKDLIERIKDANKEEEYSQAIKALLQLTGKQEAGALNEEIPNGELQALSQSSSVHLGSEVKDEQTCELKPNLPLIGLISNSESSSQSTQSTIIISENHFKEATGSRDLENIFEEETVRNSPPNMGDLEPEQATSLEDSVWEQPNIDVSSSSKADEIINIDNSSLAETVGNSENMSTEANYDSDATVASLENSDIAPALPFRAESANNTDISQVFEPPIDKACGSSECDFENSHITEKDTAKCTDEKLQFFKSLSVIPKNTTEEPPVLPMEDDTDLTNELAVSKAKGSDSDVFGDASDCETSAEDQRTENKRKLKGKARKSLLKLISEFYMKRKRERERGNDSSSSSAGRAKRVVKRTPRKKRDLKTDKTKEIISDKDSSDEQFESTQKADFRTVKWLSEPDGENQVVKPFKRKSVQPLPSSSDLEDPLMVTPFKRGTVRPFPTIQSDDNDMEQSQIVSPFKRKVVLPLPDSQSGTEEPSIGQKRSRDSESSETDFDAPTQVVSGPLQGFESSSKRQKTCSESSHTAPFEMDDDARDDLLEMLDQSHKDTRMVDAAENTPSSQFKLCDSDRDNLLNLLTDKEREEGVIDDDQLALGSQGRDELLELLSGKGDDNTDPSNPEHKGRFQLTDSDKDELLDLLLQETDFHSDSERIDRKVLLKLVEEFEEACRNKPDVKSSDNCNSCRSDSNIDSDENSVILDILREETVDQVNQTSKRGPGRPKDQGKEAWNAYQSLLKAEDDISDGSSEESIFDAKVTSDQMRHDAKLRQRFDVKRELFVDLEQTDVSKYDLPAKRNVLSYDDDDSIDRLCDLSNILRKGRRTATLRCRPKFKIDRLRGSNSDSTETSDEEHSNRESDIISDVTTVQSPESLVRISDDEENERLANALFDNIKNSSDDQSEWTSGRDVSSSDDETKKKKIPGLRVGGGKRKLTKAKDDNDESSHNSSDSNNNSSESEDNDKPEQEIKRVELDSSDEEYFMGVRIKRGAWRRDPLLNECLTSTDSGSDSGPSGLKRTRKRKDKKRKKSLDEEVKTPCDSDSSDFEIIEKEKTPQKTIVITDEEDTPTKKGKGRRNIRALLEDDDLAEATQRANNEEKDRIKRLQERDKTKGTFTQSQSFSEDDHEPLILDVHNDIQIKVHPKIVKKLKPHQKEGIQFMWDSCYLSLKDLEEGYEGSGCILAHCMGLGKTLQALALIQALFSHPTTKTKHVLVVCPLSTVLNWKNEYNLAYKHIRHSHIKLYTIENPKAASLRIGIVKDWRKTGGILVLGYEGFGLMINEQKLEKWEGQVQFRKEDILEALVDPGPELIICDEGHLLRNKQSQRTLALNKVKTRRRIVLTGTPLQNNLEEYYYMVQFVKPNLLGNEKEYKTNFVHPIVNGQYEDSTTEDIMFMKKRTHCLHKILNKTVQRVEDTELKQYLPKLIDQAVFVKLSDMQVKLYNTYLDSINARPVTFTKTGHISRPSFLADVQVFKYICLHPNVITIAEKGSKKKIKEQDVIDDNFGDEVEEKVLLKGGWYKGLLPSDEPCKLEAGTKVAVTLAIIREAVANGDKVLIFSEFHAEMDSLEAFTVEHLEYKKNHDYCRMDGTSSPIMRTQMCDKFNKKNSNLKVFMMSLKVGGLGLNLTAANRIVIMNVNWNPSWDTQSVFRSFRFGQTKPVYVYRLVALDTMEEKMYQRVVTKLAVAHRVVDKHQITRHYTEADIQEFYSTRPVIDKPRPTPNLPEDRILANLLQKYQFVYRWHEHQALLANRPEEDLDEQQKNAAWEEYNKPTDPTPVNVKGPVQALLAQPGPSGLQNKVAGPPALSNPTLSHYPDHDYSLPKSRLVETSQSKYMPRPLFVDVSKPRGGVMLSHQTRAHKPPTTASQNLLQNPLNLVKKMNINPIKAQAILKTQIRNPVLNKAANLPRPQRPKSLESPATNANQSPLQKQVRTFMDHLHLLQMQMKTPLPAPTTTIKPPLVQAHKVSPNRVPRPVIGRANYRHSSGVVTSKMQINGVPVTHRVVHHNPRPKKILISQKSRAVAVPPTNSPLQRKMVANMKKGPPAAIPNLKRYVSPSVAMVPNRFKTGGNFRTYEGPRKPTSIPNKENIKNRRLSNRAEVIDLSGDEDRAIPISPEVLNNLRKKGVSVNYVTKGDNNDVIKLD